MHVAQFNKVLAKVRLLDACVGEVPRSQREFVFPHSAEPKPDRDVSAKLNRVENRFWFVW